jgi:predicted DNA binding protein
MTHSEQKELMRVTLDVWHPDCWGITSTDEVGSGLVGHGAAIDGSLGYERCTIHGDSTDHVTQAIEVAQESQFIRTIERLGDTAPTTSPGAKIGRSTQDVFIEYDATEGMGSAFLERGFVLDSTYRIDDGLETWELLVYATRSSFKKALDQIRQDRDADITLTRLSPARTAERPTEESTQQLTPRQHEAFALARHRGYYEWPRAVSAKQLATELDISKATFLEHLRKAEAKLLAPDQ